MWDEFWNNLITDKKLHGKIEEMNEIDQACGHELTTEQICHKIYDDYNNLENDLKATMDRFFENLVQALKDDSSLKDKPLLDDIHLHSGRVKTRESLIAKVAEKRYKRIRDKNSGYANISEKTYRDVVTDLIGIRIIINYRKKWSGIHTKLMELFPLNSNLREGETEPHPKNGSAIMAQIPVAYYAHGDDIDEYELQGIKTREHEKNYRSIHYVISYEGTYIEVQLRTIYDEAWSDTDHDTVYKHEENKSHAALEELSRFLAGLTNLSADIGDHMRDTFFSESGNVYLDDGNGHWKTSAQNMSELNAYRTRLRQAENILDSFIESCVEGDQ